MTDTEPNAACLLLDGPLTVRTIAAVRSRLMEFLASPGPIRVDATAADSIDLSFIQLLLAARHSAQAAGRQFQLASPASGALRIALDQGGFAPGPFWRGDT